jgi:hypothetical protein
MSDKLKITDEAQKFFDWFCSSDNATCIRELKHFLQGGQRIILSTNINDGEQVLKQELRLVSVEAE